MAERVNSTSGARNSEAEFAQDLEGSMKVGDLWVRYPKADVFLTSEFLTVMEHLRLTQEAASCRGQSKGEGQLAETRGLVCIKRIAPSG
jgi:hypothetical protein